MTDQVFVLGCERSGTTALALTLASHFGVVMGMERYRGLYRDAVKRADASELGPHLFTEDRFFAFDPVETRHIPPETRFTAMYEAAEVRFGTDYLRWVGDKVFPADPWLYLALADRFPRARFLVIWRDPIRVANSFELRARNPDDVHWPESNGYTVGVEHWNRAVDAAVALAAEAGDGRLLTVRAEELFGPSIDGCRACTAFLDLEPWDGTDRAWADHRDTWTELQATDLVLDADQQDEVAAVTASAFGRMADLDECVGLRARSR